MKRPTFADYPQVARERVIDALQDIARDNHAAANALQSDDLEALEEYHRDVAEAAGAVARMLREVAQ